MGRLPRPLRWIIGIVVGTVILLGLAALTFLLTLRASLARLDGPLPIPGLTAPVTVERDDQGLVTLSAGDRADAARALGFLHAQERFFQMDLLRRSASGTLAELFGPAARPRDRKVRPFRGRFHAAAALGLLPPEEHAILDAYTAGVNAGLDALVVRPPEYLFLRQTPAPWQSTDTLLLSLTFGFALQDAAGDLDRQRDLLLRAVGPAAYRFYNPLGSDWDAALDGHVFAPLPIPRPDEFSAPEAPKDSPGTAAMGMSDDAMRPGSNAWALAGRRTRSGSALIADDMHLDLGLPNVWFRAVLKWRDADGRQHRLAGITVPGAPTLIVGSNGDIAWGFTNSQIDTTDVIDLELAPEHPGQYRTPDGWRDFEVLEETLRAAGAPAETMRVTNTIWGPVIPVAGESRMRAVCWVMARPASLASRFVDLEKATNVTAALDAAARSARPVQNFVVGDRAGNIGWTLIGAIPDRFGTDGTRPVSWADGTAGWHGLLPPERHPRVVNPESGQIWTANQRILGDAGYLALGDGGWDLGSRAAQIRDDLSPLKAATPAEMLAIQLDDQARLFQNWRERLMPALDRLRSHAAGTTNEVVWASARQRISEWDGKAAATSTAFPFVARFRREAVRLLFEPVQQAVRKLEPKGGFFPNQAEAVVQRLLADRPVHLLNRRYSSYEGLLDEAARRANTAGEFVGTPTWGGLNRLQLHHPFSEVLPALSRWLDLPSSPQSGYAMGMPRIAAPRFGASERLGVSPGHEEEAYLHMPGGQSGHFLSPYYAAGHSDWRDGVPTPLLGGPVRHLLILSPARP